MKLHVLALPHTQLTDQYLTCAYSQKVRKFARMFGSDVIVYGPEQADDIGDAELVTLISEEERAGWFGDGFNTVSTPLEWTENKAYWRTANGRAVGAIMERMEDPTNELLLLTTSVQLPVARALGGLDDAPKLIPCEWAVGYEGVRTNNCAFESLAWMHHVYGLQQRRWGRWYDSVIPNFFDPNEFPKLPPVEDMPDEYLLFMGRIIQSKGVDVALKVAERAGLPLVVAGPGTVDVGDGWMKTQEGWELGPSKYLIPYPEVQSATERAALMQHARAFLAPTQYIEPFGGVAVEAMMCGTPAITTDWGAFTETVPERFRFRTLAEGAECVAQALINNQDMRTYAMRHYSLDAVKPKFERWFEQLLGLWGPGWSA